MSKTIWAIRHGEYERGKLIPAGEEQALAAAKLLVSKGLGRDALVLTATTQRAAETAEIIARHLMIQTILHSERVAAAGGEEQNGIRHFGEFIEQTLAGYDHSYNGLVVVGSEPLIGRAKGRSPDAAVGYGEVVTYEYDPDDIIPDDGFLSPSARRRLEDIQPPWQPVRIGE